MRVTVCQLSDSQRDLAKTWPSLVEHTRKEQSDLVVLPELPFTSWLFDTRTVDSQRWEVAADEHEHWCQRFSELLPASVAATRPITVNGARLNQAFVWEQGATRRAHEKYHMPDEEGFWEASWCSRGDADFQPLELGELRVGFLICTELWFFEHARSYGLATDAHLLINPRATLLASADLWLSAGRAAAVVSGAYCVSSNRCGARSQLEFGGLGWIVDPEGQVLATTSMSSPFATAEIDLEMAARAKLSYPRYIARADLLTNSLSSQK